ncbi:MAG: hypothetical protein JSS49_28925 [Planctomycetes bacterium]|nr:hypothetical protein [Planctomycetota bacterium]
MYFQQVVDNIAMFQSNPDTLPQFATIADGTTQLSDSATATNTIGWNLLGYASDSLALQGNRQLMGNWKLTPTIAMANRLRRMRCAFQLVATGYPTGFIRSDEGRTLTPLENDAGFGIFCVREMQDFGLLPRPKPDDDGVCTVDSKTSVVTFKTPEDANAFEAKFEETLNRNFPRCWYHVGSRKQVPKCACYVSHGCCQSVWVDADGTDALSRFTLTTVNIATTDPPAASSTMVTVKRKFNIGSENWELSAAVSEKDVDREIKRLADARKKKAKADLAKSELELLAAEKQVVEAFNGLPKTNRKAQVAMLPEDHRQVFDKDFRLNSNGLPQLDLDLLAKQRDEVGAPSWWASDATPDAKSKLNEALARRVEVKKSITANQAAVASAEEEINEAPQFTISPTVTDPFNRTPSLPLSRSGPGIEFVTPPPAIQ